MGESTQTLAPPRTADAIAAHVRLSPEAAQLLRSGLSPRAFFELLAERDLTSDALRFLAQAMPKRRAVWWGCLCAWHNRRPELEAAEAAALRAAVCWVLEPTEERRRAAEQPGREAKFSTPAGCLAMAAFWSGGSMTRPELPVVRPPAHLTGRLVGGTVLLAAARHEPLRYRFRCREFLALGRAAAAGVNLWLADDQANNSAARDEVLAAR